MKAKYPFGTLIQFNIPGVDTHDRYAAVTGHLFTATGVKYVIGEGEFEEPIEEDHIKAAFTPISTKRTTARRSTKRATMPNMGAPKEVTTAQATQ